MNCQEFWKSSPELGDSRSHPHLVDCPACAARVAQYGDLHAGLRILAATVRRSEAPARVERRLIAEFRRQNGTGSRAPSRRWAPVVTWAAALAAMIALAVFLVRPREPEALRPPVRHTTEMAALVQSPQADSDGFIPLPNTAGVAADGDEVNLVRMEVPRSTMIALGLDVGEERAAELVEADVMLGSNGVARAVRFLD